ncbi:glutamine--fructose-6-phosphate transaminase (isomerizing) [bacterium]|nr:glutamine--fructose-6-phosphate transaminase (isomerizing) [bacterium]|tara:strand:- start:34667 stop:36445 length:1779 start_codon:yes stop_codon:yes gene_type:complete
MCGIFGYIGNKNAGEKIIEGLKRLEYRGYDSWGVAVKSNSKIDLIKKMGKIGEVQFSQLSLPSSNIAIGHTRWATTGDVSNKNAHPHCSSDQTFVLAHNGIVENYKELKKNLYKNGHRFKSETDTEVIVRLIESKLNKSSDFKIAVQKAFLDLKGRNTIILLRDNGDIVAARNGSPLVVGLDEKNQDIYLSSDTLSFAQYVKKTIIIENNQLVFIRRDNVKIFNIKTGKNIKYHAEKLDIKDNKIDKGDFDHFMIKEINENPFVINQVVKQSRRKYDALAREIKKAKNIYTIGSGTAGFAAAQIAYYLRAYGKIRAVSLVGADAREYFNLFRKGDLLIAPSQSGETADVLEVLEYAQKKGAQIVSYVNMEGSTMARMSDFKFSAQAGPEVCVMSTKIFTSQIAWGYLVAKTVQGKYKEGINNLQELIKKSQLYLKNKKSINTIKNLSHYLHNTQNIFLMGKSQNLQIMNEGMVKLIEGTYKHAHSIPAGDLKHYAITLIEKGVIVIVAISNDEVKPDILNAAGEVRARGAYIIGVGSDDSELFNSLIKVPDTGETSAIMNLIPLQLLAYFLTVELGNNVDKPRNIAKSVTVK